ncbi:MAG: prepilin peptidase [Candidatus Paceibacterota bacterium]|jgi:prepilin signal peptidase PulO-like enzyme (type II secretory pathway)
MQYIFGVLIFFVGTALGSFIAVIADRYNTGLPWTKGRSICFSCDTELKNKDLFPLFSFLWLKGKCRYCQSKIPRETFFVEILMGALTVLAVFKSGFLGFDFSSLILNSYFIIQFLLLTAIFGNILLISIYDLKHFIIPDVFLICFFVFAFILNSYFIIHNSLSYFFIIQNLLSGLVLTLPFLLIFLISRGAWFGFGDVKYIAVLGFFLGLVQGLSAVVLAFWIGAVFAVLALVFKKITPYINLPLFKNNLTIKSEIPFGPFLSLGIIISFYLSLDLFYINEIFKFF